jgi:hypothetical protein
MVFDTRVHSGLTPDADSSYCENHAPVFRHHRAVRSAGTDGRIAAGRLWVGHTRSEQDQDPGIRCASVPRAMPLVHARADALSHVTKSVGSLRGNVASSLACQRDLVIDENPLPIPRRPGRRLFASAGQDQLQIWLIRVMPTADVSAGRGRAL